MRIGINCGHTVDGQPGSGAVGIISESAQTRAVGKRLMTLLLGMGHTVYDCTNDYAPSTASNLSQIVDMANKQPLDLFVSIHFNSGGGRGSEVFTYGGNQFQEAQNVCLGLAALGFVNRGVKDGSSLYVIRNTNAKSMLVEVCFVDTASDVELYRQVGAGNVAAAIAAAITGQKSEEDIDMTKYEELKAENEALKERVARLENPVIYNYIDDNMPEWARDAVRWCVDNGIIRGTDANGSLGLDYDKLWLCVVIYRLAQRG